MAALGACVIFTLLYLVTGKKRNDGVVFRAFTSQSYFVALPVATRADDDAACAEEKGDDCSISDSVVLLNKGVEEVPVARRTVPPVVAVRRPQTLTHAQANMFYLDTQGANSARSSSR